MDEHLVNLPSSHVEMDELWSFVGHKNRGKEDPRELIHDPVEGDVWVWKCICADTKLIIGWHVGGRTFENAVRFCRKLPHRFAKPPQISTDGLQSYPLAISYAFGNDEYAHGRLIKLYSKNKEGREVCIGARKVKGYGKPDMERTCTSFVERSNLTMRMQNRRFARKTNAHSKIVPNHKHMIALGFMHFNFCRVHQTLKRTPAMAAGVSSHVWSLREVVEMMDASEAAAQERAFALAFRQTWAE